MHDTFVNPTHGTVRQRGRGPPLNRGGRGGYNNGNSSFSNGRGGRGRGGSTWNNYRRPQSPDEKEYDLFEDDDSPPSATPPPTHPPPYNNDNNRRDNRNNGPNSSRGRGRPDMRKDAGPPRRGGRDRDDSRRFSPIRDQNSSFNGRRANSPSPNTRYRTPPFNESRREGRRSPSPPRNNGYMIERKQSSSRYQPSVENELIKILEENERDVAQLEEQLARAKRRVDDSYQKLQHFRRNTEMSCQQSSSISTIESINGNTSSSDYVHLDTSDVPSTSTDAQISEEDQSNQEEDQEAMQNLTNQIKNASISPFPNEHLSHVSSDKLTEVAAKLKPAVITARNRVSILTNYWDVKVEPKTVYRYDVNVQVVVKDKLIAISEGPKNDVERHQMCLAALRTALQVYSAFRRQAGTVYDCANQLYTSEELDSGTGEFTVEIPALQLPSSINDKFPQYTSVRVTISPNASMPSFDISDFSKENNRNQSENDKNVSNFLNMLTNESAQRSGLTVFGSGRVFDMRREGEKIGRGQEKRMGIDKGIKFIEGGISPSGNNGRNKRPSSDHNTLPALLLDAKCGMFFTSQSVLNTLRAYFGNVQINWREVEMQLKNEPKRIRNGSWVEINQYLKGLRFERTYSSKKSFTISGISEKPIKSLSFTKIDGTRSTVLDYLTSEIGIQFDGNLPAVVVKIYDANTKSHKEFFFAMESIVLTPNQRVPISKQTEPPRPIRPQERWERITRLIGELNLEQGGRRNEIMRMFGVSLSETPKKVTGVRREAPKVIFGNGKQADMGFQRCDWKSADKQALDPARSSAVIVAYPKKDHGIALGAKEAISRKCNDMGIRVDKWYMMDIDSFPGETEHKKVCSLFDAVASSKQYGGNPLIIFLDWEKSKSHDSLKLAERRSKIVSQQVTMEKAMLLKKQQMTCANVVKKMNVKMGGLNYRVDPEIFAQSKWIGNGKDPLLIISYDVAHPGRVNKNEANVLVPSVVGFAFNGGTHPEAFVGDYHFQLPKMEQVDSIILNERVKWMLESFIKNRKCWPSKILVIRDGVSEGQYTMVLKDELEALKEGCREFGNLNKKPDWCPPFGLVIATKRHSTRLFKEGNRGVENCQPLTVVDRDIVKPHLNEAYIVSAHALQGTARPVCYSILKNEIGIENMDEFESIMLGLTFHHQISDSPISLPEPVYQADEWAKRGNNMWKAFDKYYTIPIVKGKKGGQNFADFHKMTENLSIWKTSLSGKRVNA